MQIEVLAVDGDYIIFRSAAGDGVGYYQYSYSEVAAGKEYDVEVDVDFDLELGDKITQSTNQSRFIKLENDITVINCLVESIDGEDDSACLRIAEDFVMIVYNNDPKIKEGDYLEMRVGKEELGITIVG
jgi:hypothetical protein